MTNEQSPRPWQVRYGDTVADATGAKVAACWRPENAALIVDAVNFYDATVDTQLSALLAERDRLRDELADKTRNYEYVIAYHIRTEESLRDIVKRLSHFVSDTACFTPSDKAVSQSLIREARAAIGEGAK